MEEDGKVRRELGCW